MSAAQADARARRIAQRGFATPLVLEAGAGTGKTAVLVARVVAWCLGPGWERNAARLADAPEDRVAAETLRRVVAITFTEAAAAEMEARVHDALLQIEGGALPIGLDEDALASLGAEVRSARARWLVASLDQLGVRTIHAWCRRLLAAHPLEAELHPRFDVDADGRRQRAVVREVLERRLAEAYEGEDLADHLALALENLGPDRIEEALVYLVEQGVPAEALAREPFDSEALEALRARFREACAELLRAGGPDLRGLSRSPRARELVELAVAADERLGDAAPAELPPLVEIAAGFEVPHRKLLGEWARGRLAKEVEAAVGDRQAAFAAAAGVLQLRLAHLARLEPESLARARRVLGPLLAEASRELRARGVESFDALLQDACRLVGSSAAARIRGEIDQLLVDEFQDTDGTQCEILRRLVLRAPAEERPGLFLVGDPKQSIYGWRRADLAAWYDFVAEVEAAGGERHPLVVNFRSVPAVLGEVERLVAPVMEERPRVQPRFQALEACPRLAAEPGFVAGGRAAVEHWVSWVWDAEAGRRAPVRSRDATELEARAIAADVAALNRDHGVAWNEVALLLRSLGELDVYLGELRAAGVPYVVERDRTYYQRREVIEAQALVRAVLDPLDAVALVALLRSAWVGVPDAALPPLWRQELPSRMAGVHDARDGTRREIARWVTAAARAMPRDVPGLDRVEGWEHSAVAALEAVGALREAFDREPADRFVELLRGALASEPSEAARYLGGYRLANLDRFFRDLVEALEETGGDASAVLAHLRRAVTDEREAEEGRPRDARDRAVHVTTIHKAKGLGFGHVYLAQMHKGEGRDDAQAPRAALRAGRLEYALFGWPTPGFDLAREAEGTVRAAERVRLLYVATTRARDRLVLCGAPQERGGASFAALARPRCAELDLEAWMGELAARQEPARVDAEGVRWRFPALDASLAAPVERDAPRDERWDRDATLASIGRLAAARARAREHEARPFSEPASAKEAPGEERRPPDAGAREAAMLAGVALHAALEHLDPLAGVEDQRAVGRERIARVVAEAGSPELREDAQGRAVEELERFLGGPLRDRLRALAPHVVARELPVLLAPDADARAVGFLSGKLDLVYRDGAGAEAAWVVADYKTDRVEGTTETLQRAAGYRRQGAIYTRALREALALPREPRFELWFIHSGQIHTVPAAP